MIFKLFATKVKDKSSVDLTELLVQSRLNVFYLRSHINVLNSNIEYFKSTSIREFRKKIETLTQIRNWMICKLKEEETLVSLFEKKLAPIFWVKSKVLYLL